METRNAGNSASTATSTRAPIAGIVLASAAGVLFLLWLIYVHHAPQQFAGRMMFLPPLIALLNGLSAIALVAGFAFIRRSKDFPASGGDDYGLRVLLPVSGRLPGHHALHGSILFAGHGVVRTVYFSILASHIVLSMVALPIILITFYFSLSGRFPQHKRIARFTFPYGSMSR